MGDMASLVVAAAATTSWFPLSPFSLVGESNRFVVAIVGIAIGVGSDRASLVLLLALNHGHNESLSISRRSSLSSTWSCGCTRRRFCFLFCLVVSDSLAICRQLSCLNMVGYSRFLRCLFSTLRMMATTTYHRRGAIRKDVGRL